MNIHDREGILFNGGETDIGCLFTDVAELEPILANCGQAEGGCLNVQRTQERSTVKHGCGDFVLVRRWSTDGIGERGLRFGDCGNEIHSGG